MKKLLILWFIFSFIALLNLFCLQGFADDDPKVISIQPYNQGTFTKNGRQFKESAWMNLHGHHTLLLYCEKDQLDPQYPLCSGTPVALSFDSGKAHLLFIDEVWSPSSEDLVICLNTDDALTLQDHEQYDIELDFYSIDMSRVVYSANISNAPANEVVSTPQTSDGAVAFILLGVASVILMTFLLAPKKHCL
jgi:hypothetical protein